MITEFTIENFRLFDHLHLPNLSRVNLIVGKNSVGKSAVLEALQLYYSKVSLGTVNQILRNRQEYTRQRGPEFNYYSHSIRYLYPKQMMPNLPEKGMIFKSNNLEIKAQISAFAGSIQSNPQPVSMRELEFIEPVEPVEIRLVVTKNSTRHSARLLWPKTTVGGVSVNKPKKKEYMLLPTNGLSDKESAQLWDEIELTEMEERVINGLQLINCDVAGVAFIEGDYKRREPVVKLSSNAHRIPLKSLGDGMTRIFQIILSLVCSKDGVLLIDEFETGLHWSVQQQAWEMIFTLAEKLNVQVFVTTHSKDCVESFEHVWSENPEQGSFYRIYRGKDSIKVQDYDSELLSDSVDTDTEVR